MEAEAPEFFHAPDHFAVDDLLVDFSDHDDDDDENDVLPDPDADVATALADSSNSSSSSGNGPTNLSGDVPDGTSFSGDLGVPYDDMAELEWLSSFVEESFAGEDVQKLHLISGFTKTRPESSNPNPNSTNSSIFTADVSVPAKARSKRSRAAASNWASRRLLAVDPNTNPTEPDDPSMAVFPQSPPPPQTQKKSGGWSRRKDAGEGGGEERRCLHCATDKTPQWRTGPMGPKTLCNACGVRYKSGRLVPEYRPAASPTFVLTKHSNSHRKVMELRRQKEMMRVQHEFLHPTDDMIFDVSSDSDHFLIHQSIGPDFRQLI
ncbi:PREDICTED: GATA transcription factor 12 [Tarenaya hassleriana]|uniref:GATA transcription factor 12 n=1 Tax=Tarenaya hassleriana TaxID=28532 RepID=UPI00053C9F6E|nr:PREDICTED: GATA transcription factor 12 [Tarenaya hassleriana]